MPPQASPKSPTSSRFSAGVHGEWSETTKSITPAANPVHSRSALAASRTGGQHLNGVCPSAMSSACRVR